MRIRLCKTEERWPTLRTQPTYTHTKHAYITYTCHVDTHTYHHQWCTTMFQWNFETRWGQYNWIPRAVAAHSTIYTRTHSTTCKPTHDTLHISCVLHRYTDILYRRCLLIRLGKYQKKKKNDHLLNTICDLTEALAWHIRKIFRRTGRGRSKDNTIYEWKNVWFGFQTFGYHPNKNYQQFFYIVCIKYCCASRKTYL